MAAGTPVGRLDMFDQESIEALLSLNTTDLTALTKKKTELMALAEKSEELLALLEEDAPTVAGES